MPPERRTPIRSTSTTGLSLLDLESESPLDVMVPRLGLVLAAPVGPANAQVNGLTCGPDQGEQPPHFGQGECCEPSLPRWRLSGGPDVPFIRVETVRLFQLRMLSTGCGPPFEEYRPSRPEMPGRTWPG